MIFTVSIIILNKNKPELLIPCVQSIWEQVDTLKTNIHIEILIGDTGSTNNSIIEFYQSIQKQFSNVVTKVIYLKKYHFS